MQRLSRMTIHPDLYDYCILRIFGTSVELNRFFRVNSLESTLTCLDILAEQTLKPVRFSRITIQFL